LYVSLINNQGTGCDALPLIRYDVLFSAIHSQSNDFWGYHGGNPTAVQA